MDDIEFRDDLPVTQVRQSWYHDFAEVLRANPGRWGKLPYPGRSRTYHVVSNINRGKINALPPEEFEARTHDRAIWVRFKGGEPSE